MNVAVDTDLLNKAATAIGQPDHAKVVELALQEMIKRRAKIQALIDFAGSIELDDGFDHKALRTTRYDAP